MPCSARWRWRAPLRAPTRPRARSRTRAELGRGVRLGAGRPSAPGYARSVGVDRQEPAVGQRAQCTLETVGHVGHAVGQSGVVDRQQRTGGQGDRAQTARRQLDPETGGHDVLDGVHLVEDEDVVIGQDGSAARHVGGVEMGVHHHHVSGGRTRPGPFGEARRSRRAAEGAGALSCRHGHGRPRPRVWLEVELGPITRGRRGGPGDEVADLGPETTEPVRLCPAPVPAPGGSSFVARIPAVRVRVGGEESDVRRQPPVVGTTGDLLRPLSAEVVGPTLQHRERKRRALAELVDQKRQLLRGQLVLERLRGRGHHDPTPRPHGRKQVGERLARSRACLHHEVTFLVDGRGHGPGHRQLTGSILTSPGQSAGHGGQSEGEIG